MEAILSSLPGAVIILLIGFVLLVKGADFFVEGASGVAKRLKVPSLIIGLTIVALGTSLPETAVSISASMMGNNEIAISNVTGSNLFNLMVVVGLCAIMSVVKVDKETIKRDIPLSLVGAILMLVFGYTGTVFGRIEGLIFAVIFVAYICFMVCSALKARTSVEEAKTEDYIPVWKAIIFIVGGAIGVAVGGDWVVDGASVVASSFGLSDTLIGLTIVAVGTSLPELVTSVVAARKNEVDMALGNAIGSNIYNILAVIGVASLISPIDFIMNNIFDLVVLIACTLVIWLFVWKKKELTRSTGIFMVAFYVAYMVYIVVRDM